MRIALALLLALAAPPALAATGEQLFGDNCASCHTVGAASTPDAPTLKGVVGRKIASLPDFKYSDGLKAKEGDLDRRCVGRLHRQSADLRPRYCRCTAAHRIRTTARRSSTT